MKCNDCNSTTIIQTESTLTCYDCGVVHQDQLYDYGPILSEYSESYDTFEPLLENDKLAIETVKRLKNWLNRDISLQMEMTLVHEVEKLADELLLYDHKCYPSHYYWAGAIIYSRKYDHVNRKQVIEYLYGKFDSGCERILKKVDKIVQDHYPHKMSNGSNGKILNNRNSTFFKTKLNNRSTNYYEKYLKEYWLDKIQKIDKFQRNKNMTESELLDRVKIKNKKEYYKQKEKLINNTKFKDFGRKKLFDKYPHAGKKVIKLHRLGMSPQEIKEELHQNYINEVNPWQYSNYNEYLEVGFCSVRTIRNYINEVSK